MRGSTSLAACVALLPLAGTLRLTPRAPAAHVARAPRRHRTAVAAADAPDDDDVPVGGLINPSDVASLSARIAKIQQTGLATPAQKLFELATAQPPQLLLRDFFRSSSPAVTDAMKEAVTSLLGQLPPLECRPCMTPRGCLQEPAGKRWRSHDSGISGLASSSQSLPPLPPG